MAQQRRNTNTNTIPDQPQQGLGENVLFEVTDGILHVRVDLNYRGGPSASGKTIRVASTNGNQQVPGSSVTLGLNAYTK